MVCRPHYQAVVTVRPLRVTQPCPPSEQLSWATSSGPAQPLVSTALGPSLSEQLSPNDRWWANGWGVAFCRWRLRQEADPSPLRGQLPHLSTSRRVTWGDRRPRGQAGGCVLEGSRALAKAAHWPGPALEVAVTFSCLCDLMAAAWVTDCMSHRLWVLTAPQFWLPEEPEGWLGPGRLAPSARMAKRDLGTRPWGCRQLRSVSSTRPGTGWKDPAWVLVERFRAGWPAGTGTRSCQPGPGALRVNVESWNLAPSCQNRE